MPRTNALTAGALTLAAALASTSAQALPFGLERDRLYMKFGTTTVAPDVDSGPLEFYGLDDAAQLALAEGPYPGTGADVSTETLPSVIVGYFPRWGNGRWSVETILATPFEFEFYAAGVARYESLAPVAEGIPTGVPALGKTLGETKMLPPVVTLVYHFAPEGRFRPFVGVGGTYIYSYHEKITNPVLTEIRRPEVEISETFAWVVQAGLDFDLPGNFFVGADVKYIGGAEVEAVVHDVLLDTSLDLIGDPVHIERTVASLEINPIIYHLTVGYEF